MTVKFNNDNNSLKFMYNLKAIITPDLIIFKNNFGQNFNLPSKINNKDMLTLIAEIEIRNFYQYKNINVCPNATNYLFKITITCTRTYFSSN